MKCRCNTVLLVPLLLSCFAAPPVTAQVQTHEEIRQRTDARIFQGMQVEIAPLRSEVIEGEDVWIQLHVWGEPGSQFELIRADIYDRLRLVSNGVAALGQYLGPSTAETRPPFADSTFLVQLNRMFYLPVEPQTPAYRYVHPYLPPGDYEGSIVFGQIVYPFAFRILEVPAELQSVWERFENLESFSRVWGYPSGPCAPGLDSLRQWGTYFCQRPVNSTWRKEALDRCFDHYGFCRSGWSIADSIFVRHLMLDWAQEARLLPHEFRGAAGYALFQGIPPQAMADAIRELAAETGKPALMAEAERFAREVEEEEER